MNISLEKIELNTYTEWIEEVKPFREITSIDTIATDCVYHCLKAEYDSIIDNKSNRTFDEDSEYTYWSGDSMYSTELVDRVVIDGEYYVFSHIYICDSDNMILVCVQPDDIWEDDEYLTCKLDDLEPIYFRVNY